MSEQSHDIGPYRILGVLGQGGMGVVYRAVHRSGRLVALKTVLVPQEGQLQSIRREIHALAGIRHPGVVRILDEEGVQLPVGEVGRLMLVSRYLSGGYWRNAEEGAKRFGVLPDGRRTYLQGDLARIGADGVEAGPV